MQAEFRNLLLTLEKELSYQEQLLGLLVKERAAVVALKQEQIEALTVEKGQLFERLRQLEQSRREAVRNITGFEVSALPVGHPAAKAEPSISDVAAMAPTGELRDSMQKIAKTLRQTAESARDIHTSNAELIKQALGLISSSLAIIRSGAEPEPITYSPTKERGAKMSDSKTALTPTRTA